MIPENKVYLFALCSPDKRFPKLRDWYLKITSASEYQISEVFDRLRSALDMNLGYNPHNFNQFTGEPASEMAILLHPGLLCAYWIQLATEFLVTYQEVYVANNGRMFPPDPATFIVHAEKSLPVLEFPTTDINENITITKWKDGIHYYLNSSIGRIFQYDKYNTIEQAIAEALKFVDESKIRYDMEKYGRRFFS